MRYRTTTKHFKLFQKECAKWIEYFGLKDWDISYHHYVGEIEDELDNMARITFSVNARAATILLMQNWGCTPTDLLVRRYAFHEVCELMLADIYVFANRRYVEENSLDTVFHTVIRKLENTVFKDIKL